MENGFVYEGEWNDDIPDGKVKVTGYIDDDEYEGEWKDGELI